MQEEQWRSQLGEPDLRLAGLQLWVHGRQYPNSHDHDDGNWLMVTAHCGANGASVWANGAILMTSDIDGWACGVEALEAGRSNEAKLSPHEPELHVTLRKTDGVGHLRMSVAITPDHMSQTHEFQFDLDQTYLAALKRECRAIIQKYPVR